MEKEKFRTKFRNTFKKIKEFFALPPRESKEIRKNWNKSQKIAYYKTITWRIVIVLILIMTLLNLYVVGTANHALFQNTKNFERFSALYQTPDWYSLSEMKVDIDKTYYNIKNVVPVFKSAGEQYSIGSQTFTYGFDFSFYKDLYPSVGTTVIYFIVEIVGGFFSITGLKFRMRQEKLFGKIFWLALILNVVLILQMLFPLL